MPKAVGRANERKRKAKKHPAEENCASSSESNVKLIKVLKGGLSNTHLDECNNDFAEFKSSRAPARKRRKQNVGVEGTTRKGLTSPVKANSVVEKKVAEEEKEQSSQDKNSKQRVRFSPRTKGRKIVSGRSNKTEDVIEVKDGENTSSQGASKGLQSDEVEEEKEVAKDSSSEKCSQSGREQPESSQGEKGKPGNHGKIVENLTDGETGEVLVPCPCCGRTASEIFPDGQGDMNNHALVCLHQKFGSKAVESNKPGNSVEEDSEMPAEKQDAVRCQICNGSLGHMSTRKRTEHVNRCIDTATESYGKGDGRVMQKLRFDHDGATTTEDEEDFFCLICRKNISHMNSRRRTQHVNRCIDSNFEEKKSSNPSTQDQSQQKQDIPTCIICGTSLNTHQKRKSHLKRCARENNISTLQLLDMVKKQELSSRDKLAAAEQPLSGQQQDRIRATETITTRPAAKARKPRKKKTEDLDEGLQVAMAISASIAEQEEEANRALGITNENPPEMGDVSSNMKGVKKKKRGRGRPAKHKPLNFPALLTRTSPENRKMWSERIGAIVDASSQLKRDVGKTPFREKSQLARIYSKNAAEWEVIGQTDQRQDEQDKTTKPIWQLTRCDALLGSTPFYVNTLKPFITPPKSTKSRIKKLRFEESPPREPPTEAEETGPSSPADLMVHGAITQEAVDALVGLAMEDEEDTSIQRSFSPSASGFIWADHGASIDEMPVECTDNLTQEQRQLLASLRDLIDSPQLEPLTIKTKDGQRIHAHHFMLQLRCPALIEDVKNLSGGTLPEAIHLQDFTKPELLAVMSYLYAGDVSFPDSYLPQIEEFAKRYHLKDLQEICSKRLERLHEKIRSPSKGGEQEKDIQDLIHSIWDDKNENSGSSQSGETSSDSQDEPLNLADFTEIYEQASSQKSYHGGGSHCSDNSSSDNDNRTDEMKDGEVDNHEDGGGNGDTEGKDDAVEVSRDGAVKTQREDRSNAVRQGSAGKKTGGMGKKTEGKDESSKDASCDGSRRSRRLAKVGSVSGGNDVLRCLEEEEGSSGNELKEGVIQMHKGDEKEQRDDADAMGDAVVNGRNTGSIGEEVMAEKTHESKDKQNFESEAEKGGAAGLIKDRRGGKDVDEGCAVNEAESQVMSKTAVGGQSVERQVDQASSSTESLNEETGTTTDSNREETSSQRKKRGRPRKKVVCPDGQGLPPEESDGLINSLLGGLGKGENQGKKIAVEKEGSSPFTPRKRGRPPKRSIYKKGKGGISTFSESDSTDQAVAVAPSPSQSTNLSGSGKKGKSGRGENPLVEDSPSVTRRKRGRPRKYKIIEKEETGKKSSESDSLDQPVVLKTLEQLSMPPDCDVLREIQSRVAEALGEGSLRFTPRKRGRPRKSSIVKKKGDMRSANSESDSLDQEVRSPLSQVSTLSGSSSDREVLNQRNEMDSIAPTPKKRGRPRKNSLKKTEGGNVESSESGLKIPEKKSTLKSQTSETLKNSQDEYTGSSKKEDSMQVLNRKPGLHRKTEGILKNGKKNDNPNRDSGGVVRDRGIGRGDEETFVSPSKVDSRTGNPYIMQERRWSLRSPQSREAQEKGKFSPARNRISQDTKKSKKITPVKMPFTKLATKKKPFKFKRIPTPLLHLKQKNDKNTSHKKKSSNSDLLKDTNNQDEFSKSANERQPSMSPVRSSTASETVEMVNGDEQTKSNKNDNLDVSATLFGNEEVSEVEISPNSERNKSTTDFMVKPASDIFSENCKISEKLKFHASTPIDFQKYKDAVSPFKINLGRKLAVLHNMSVNHAGEEVELLQDVTNSKGKENMPELTNGDHLSPVVIDKTLSFDDDDGNSVDDGSVIPVVSPPSPVQPSPSRVSEIPSPSPSPIFNNISTIQEDKRSKEMPRKTVKAGEKSSVEGGVVIQVEDIEPNAPLQQEGLDASPCKSLNGSMSLSLSNGLFIGSGNDEELASRSLLSQPVISLSRRIPDSPVHVGENSKNGLPSETDEVKIREEMCEDEVNSVLGLAECQSGGGKSSKEDNQGEIIHEVADRDDEEIDLPQGIDNAEDFAFDLEGDNFEESLHLGREEVVRDSQRTSGVASPRSTGRPESSSPAPVKGNMAESEKGHTVIDSIDLTTDEEEEEDCRVKSVVMGEIDLTDDEAIDLTDDEDVEEDANSSLVRKLPLALKVSGRADGPRGSVEGSTSHSQEIVSGDPLPGEIRTLPIIEGCSESFMEDLVAAPSDEQFWSDSELGRSPCVRPEMTEGTENEPAVSTDQPATQILNARSISLEEFCSPAPITPMPPYDEMVTPQLAEELSKYGVKKLKRKQARLKLKELYHYTHQVMQEDEPSDETTAESSKEKQVQEKESGTQKGAKLPEKSTKSKKKSTKPAGESKKGSKSAAQHETNTDPVFAAPREVSKSKSGAKVGGAKGEKKRQLNKAASQEHLEGEKMDTDISSSQSSGSDERDDFGESILYDEEADDIPASQSTSNPEESIQKYIFNNPEFYQKCLQFQPFDLDEFQAELKANNIKVSKSKLMSILDSQCLTFRHKNRNRRSPKKKKKKVP